MVRSSFDVIAAGASFFRPHAVRNMMLSHFLRTNGTSEALMTALAPGNPQNRAVGFRTWPRTAAMFLNVAGWGDLPAASLKARGKCFIRSNTVSMGT